VSCTIDRFYLIDNFREFYELVEISTVNVVLLLKNRCLAAIYKSDCVTHPIMNHSSRDIEGAGVAHEVNSSKPQFSQITMGQYWLGIKAFRLTRMLFKSCCGF